MSIFTRIKEAIFGAHAQTRTAGRAEPNRAPAPTPPTGAQTTVPTGIPVSPVNVDVEATLADLAAKNPQKLNWKSSIVDLMKLLDIDSTLENRKSLAEELGYSGDAHDSAQMNLWLHRRVMQELEKNGGRVPASLVA